MLGTALRPVRLEPARFAELDSGGQSARAIRRPAQCFFRRYSRLLLPSLRHRLILNLEADAEGVSAEKILERIDRSQVPEVA